MDKEGRVLNEMAPKSFGRFRHSTRMLALTVHTALRTVLRFIKYFLNFEWLTTVFFLKNKTDKM